jgi:hypothetical protein
LGAAQAFRRGVAIDSMALAVIGIGTPLVHGLDWPASVAVTSLAMALCRWLFPRRVRETTSAAADHASGRV